MRPFRPRLTYANVVSTICLFIVLGGGAWAAKTQLAKNSVGTPQLKAGAVTGAKVKDGSLTGADINAATLGKVPQATSAESAANASHATSADNAGHANTAGTADHATSATSADHATSADTAARAEDANALGGNGPAAYYPAGGIQRIEAAPVYGEGAVTIYSANGLTLRAVCNEGGLSSAISFQIFAISTATGSHIAAGYVEKFGPTEKPVVRETNLTPGFVAEVWSTFGSTTGDVGEDVGNLAYSDGALGIDFTLATSVKTNRECRVSGTAAVTG